MGSILKVQDEDRLERGEQVLGVGGHLCSWRTCFRGSLNDFGMTITNTSAFLWFVGVVLRLDPRPCTRLATRRGGRGRLPLVFLLRRKSADDGTDDDRDCPIWQQTTPT